MKKEENTLTITLTHIPYKKLADKDDTKTLFSCHHVSYQGGILGCQLLQIFWCRFGTHTSSFPESK
jgi:hypothetical protein